MTVITKRTRAAGSGASPETLIACAKVVTRESGGDPDNMASVAFVLACALSARLGGMDRLAPLGAPAEIIVDGGETVG